MGQILKISVLADGRLLLDGADATLDDLSRALEQAQPDAAVWYYRESAAGEPPSIALDVMKLVAARRLPVRLSAKPDFSDSVPSVDVRFAPVRKKAAQRHIVIVRPDGRPLVLPALARSAAPPSAVEAVEEMLPSTTQRHIAVIADTSWAMSDKPVLQDADRAIPFFGMLMGFAAIGHAVWIFHGGDAGTVEAGCAQADVAIVDSARISGLPAEWPVLAARAMRNRQVLLFDRATTQLRSLSD